MIGTILQVSAQCGFPRDYNTTLAEVTREFPAARDRDGNILGFNTSILGQIYAKYFGVMSLPSAVNAAISLEMGNSVVATLYSGTHAVSVLKVYPSKKGTLVDYVDPVLGTTEKGIPFEKFSNFKELTCG